MKTDNFPLYPELVAYIIAPHLVDKILAPKVFVLGINTELEQINMTYYGIQYLYYKKENTGEWCTNMSNGSITAEECRNINDKRTKEQKWLNIYIRSNNKNFKNTKNNTVT